MIRPRLANTAAAAPKPDLDAELEKQLDEILREIDPDGLVDDAEELAMLEGRIDDDDRAESGAAASTSGAASAAAPRGRPRGPPLPPHVLEQQQEERMRRQQEAEAQGDSALVDLEGLPEGTKLTLGEQRRKGAVLIELLRAGANLDEQIAKFRHEIDDVLVLLMKRRMETAVEVQEEPEAIANYRYLYALLRRERDRAAASPALRLLDDVLSVLGEGAAAGAGREAGGPDAAEARRRAATMMRDAFTGGALPVDIFTAAAALAQDGPLAADALSVEAVSPVAFLSEAAELLEGSKRELQEAQEAVANFQAELAWARRNRPELLEQPEVAARVKMMQQAEAQLEPRREAVAQLEEAIKIAGNLDLGSL